MFEKEQFKEALYNAGSTFDGHVTNGSIDAQMQLIENKIRKELQTFALNLKAELKAAGDFGRFDLSSDAVCYPEYTAIEVLKEVGKKYGLEGLI
jgi:hypothetical protein